MKFLADESVDYQIVDHLRQNGHEIWYVAEMEPGISDDAVLDEANKKMAILLTSDKDFCNSYFDKAASHGVFCSSGSPEYRKPAR